MAGVAPSFITGAKAVVKVNNTALAFCSDVSYNINVQHIPVEALGIFEIISNEPVSYSVDGSFSVIRYSSGDATQLDKFATALDEGSLPTNTASGMGLKDHINPAKIITSETFDLDVVQKGSTNASPANFFKISDCRITRRGSSLNKRGLLVDNYAFVGILAEDTTTDTADQIANTPGLDT